MDRLQSCSPYCFISLPCLSLLLFSYSLCFQVNLLVFPSGRLCSLSVQSMNVCSELVDAMLCLVLNIS